jgi:hypothetical protein
MQSEAAVLSNVHGLSELDYGRRPTVRAATRKKGIAKNMTKEVAKH